MCLKNVETISLRDSILVALCGDAQFVQKKVKNSVHMVNKRRYINCSKRLIHNNMRTRDAM